MLLQIARASFYPLRSGAPLGQKTRGEEGEREEEGDRLSDEEDSEETLKKAREWDEFKDGERHPTHTHTHTHTSHAHVHACTCIRTHVMTL